jgi:parallel beta-helix repeat protein
VVLKNIFISSLFLFVFFSTPFPTHAQTSSCLADLNDDLKVNLADYTILSANFMKDPLLDEKADLNNDSKVNLADYTLLAADFMKDCQLVATSPSPSPSPTPEISPNPSPSPVLEGYYYVSPQGDDTNTGTVYNPFKTFEKALSVLQPGDTLKIAGGTYHERLKVTISGQANNPIKISPWDNTPVIIDLQNNDDKNVWITGNYINIEGIETKNSAGYCVSLEGTHIISNNFKVHDCQDHGTYVDGQDIIVDGHEIYRTNLSYQARNQSSGWGSALKVRVGGDNITLRNNKIYHNYGEGIAVTRGTNTVVQDNHVFDNYAVNIYIDNSYDVIVERNFVTCSGNSGYEYLNGDRMNGIGLAEEEYSGWGAQLKNVRVQNNIVNGCQRGFIYFGADVPNGGLDNVLVAHNTFWNNTKTGIGTEPESYKTRNTVIANNIIHFASGGKFAVIASRDGIDMHHNFWVGGTPDDWMNALGTGDIYNQQVTFSTNPSLETAQSFKIGSDSPAVNQGGPLTPYSNILTDFSKQNRSAPNDIGAFEY